MQNISALRRRSAIGTALVAAIVACRPDADPKAIHAPVATNAAPGTNALPNSIPFAGPEDGQWVRPAKDYASSRFADLSEINSSNVANLKVSWTFSTGVLRGQESAPLVVNNTMYIVTPYPNFVYALDLAHEGQTKWMYKPKTAAAAQGVACCDVVNRGLVFDNGRLFLNTLDNHTIALDADTGREMWNTQLGDLNLGQTMTMAPLVVKGKVLVGNSGGEMGVRGWLTALNESDGSVAWRAYSTGPDSDVLIGSEFRPFYPQNRGKDLGKSTWPGDAWQVGGGTVWGWISYDPDLNLIYYGTANPGPWNAEQRPGDNLWTAGVFARNPDNGHAYWYYQWSPHDLFDHDGINENILLNLPIGGQQRKVLLRVERNGFIYALDRNTGQVLSADPFVYQTAYKGFDLKAGRPIPVKEKEPQVGKVVREICPAAPGAKDFNPAAFSPRTGLVYIPHNNLCMDFEGLEANYIAGTPYVGANVKIYPGPGGNRGVFSAWDPVARKMVWEVKENFPVFSSTVVTSGDVVFYGTMEGYFKALDARTGKLLWKFRTGSGIISQPITYRGPDGKQYVAVLSGVGGWPGAIVAGNLDPRDSTAALGFVNAMKDLPKYSTKGGTLYVFSL